MRRTIFVSIGVLAALASGPHAQELANGGVPARPLALVSARVALEGTSNIHDWTASTSTIRLTSLELNGTAAVDPVEQALRPGGLTSFAVEMPVVTLTSPRDGVDKNMLKALKAADHPTIRFRLHALQPVAAGYHAVGSLMVAGVEKELTLNLTVARKGGTLTVAGTFDVLMTDFGITPPRALLGMLRTDPKVRGRVEVTLTTPQT